MSRNKGLAILQKTYDESYLKCSTAVYYESQGNEAEAMRCWRDALHEILEHHASKILPNYTPRSETEKALIDSLGELQLQCKERIDLLEALRLSRQEDSRLAGTQPSASKLTKFPDTFDTSSPTEKGWIGQGTIPAVTYPELSRPSLPPRPSLPERPPSDRTITADGIPYSRSSLERGSLSPSTALTGSPSAPASIDTAMRSPSPEKHTMRTTLRSGRPTEKSTKSGRKLAKSEGPGASKAAALAWSALSSKDRLFKTFGAGGETTTPCASPASAVDPSGRKSTSSSLQWDIHTRRLVTARENEASSSDSSRPGRHSDEYLFTRPSALSISAASSALKPNINPEAPRPQPNMAKSDELPRTRNPLPQAPLARAKFTQSSGGAYKTHGKQRQRKDYLDEDQERRAQRDSSTSARNSTASEAPRVRRQQSGSGRPTRPGRSPSLDSSASEEVTSPHPTIPTSNSHKRRGKGKENAIVADMQASSPERSSSEGDPLSKSSWNARKKAILKKLPPGVDEHAAKQILNEIVVQGDEVRWSDIAGLEIAKNALRETVVYPFLRPDLFMGLREPARGMLLFGPPGTGKTMLARAVATESRSTFFSISASSLTSKYLGESEKLVRALFLLAKEMAPSIIFVDEIDSLLSQRSGSGEHEATMRIKTEFLIQWSDLQRAAAGRMGDDEAGRGDPNRVLVLAATNLPWAIDEAARRRFVRRQYIPLPEPETRATQLGTLLGQQKHSLTESDIEKLIVMTDGFSGSDITALAKDAAMGPLRSLGEALLDMTMEDIRPISFADFEASLSAIRPSVSKAGLKEYEDWAKAFGERGG